MSSTIFLQRVTFLALSASIAVTGVLVAAGCSGSGEEDATSSEDEVRIRPDGSDQPGELVVKAPAGARGVEPTYFSVAPYGAQASLRESLSPLPVGQSQFMLVTEGPTFSLKSPFGATIKRGETTTITTALLGVDAVGGPATLGLGEHSPSRGIHIRERGTVKSTSTGSKLAPLLAGTYEIQFGLLDGVRVTLAPGETKKVVLTDPTGRRVTRLKAPTRELPTVDWLSISSCQSNGNQRARWEIGYRNSEVQQSVNVADGKELDLGLSELYQGSAYTIRAPSWAHAVELPSGELGAGPLEWHMGRIDVDDVAVNGTMVRGTYDVFPANAQGARAGAAFVRCTLPTNTGVDVPPGRYRVEVKYRTTEAGDKTLVHVVDVP